MTITTMADEEKHFRGLVIPVGCHPYQEQEMIRSFYAGASSMLKIVYEIADRCNDDDEEETGKYIAALQDELDAFCDRVQRGQA